MSNLEKEAKVTFDELPPAPFHDPSIPQIKGDGLGLPDFLKKRAAMPKVIDPMADAFALRQKTGNVMKANPNVNVPVEPIFRLQLRGPDIRGQTHSEPSEKAASRPPKAVYVKKNRKELYEHKLELKPFTWFDQKGAKETLNKFLDSNKQKGQITDVQAEIRNTV